MMQNISAIASINANFSCIVFNILNVFFHSELYKAII